MIKELDSYKIWQTSPQSLLLEWDFKISQTSIKALQTFKNHLLLKDKEIQFVTSAFKSILIKYKNPQIDISTKKNQIQDFIESIEKENLNNINSNVFKIPVCYENYGIDLEFISKQSGLSIPKIIEIHTNQVYTLYFIGFLPGFLYLGDINKKIQAPRHKTPRAKVEKGSVGIAENQTGIYPMSSPGGWQIIGQTPIDLFDVNQNPPSQFQPSDKIQFYAIDQSEFDRLKKSEISIQKLKQND